MRYAAARVPVAVVSGAYRREIEPVLELAGLAECVTALVAADDVTRGKPDPEGYVRALAALGDGLAPSDVVAFEDTEAGVASARGAGLRCLAVRGHAPGRAARRGRRHRRRDRRRARPVARRMTWVIAHRGASVDERENTLPAFERAIAVGADFVELDVQVSADGALVVFHDVDLDRLTPLRGPLAGIDHSRSFASTPIPTLEDVLELTRGRIGVMAELKSPHLYRRHDVAGRTAALLGPTTSCSRSRARALLEAKRGRPDLRLLQHVGLGVSIRAASSYAWGVGFWDPRVTGRGLAKARKLGLATTVYTVNEPERMREARRARRGRDLHGLSGSSTGGNASSVRASSRGLDGGEARDDARPDRERSRAGGRQIGDEARAPRPPRGRA